MNSWIGLLFVALMWRNVRGEYGTSCISPGNFSSKCVPIASCANVNAKFSTESNCSLFENVQHVCCAENQIQYNTNTLTELRKLRCGKFSTPNIGNGKAVKPWSRPWMALLGYNRINYEVFSCGGSLISDRFVLTAAHCVAGLEEELEKVRLGEHDISKKTDCVSQTRFRQICNDAVDVGIDKIFIHEGYQMGFSYNDIALLRLSKPVMFSKFISPICLPITKELQNKVNVLETFFVSGWGITENGNTSDVLLEARVKKATLDTCSSVFRKTFRDTQICIGGNDNKESCKGDSGGPLQGISSYIQKYSQRMVQFGIVSFGDLKCGDYGLFGIYTNVAHYIQWITDQMAR